MKHMTCVATVLAAAMTMGGGAMADSIPASDARLGPPQTTNTPVTMRTYRTLAEWQARAAQLRTRVLVGAGLWPMPPRTPLHPQVTGRVERDGYSIEKVLLETMPGFFLGGNLYRPVGRQAPVPAILCPHGHWAHGRLEDTELASIPGRCINLARLGFVVFAYDMIGYNDTRGLDHKFAGNPLWGVSLQGLQLWNSLRAVDFVAALPDVDAQRLGCTGASGGGTQTFLLTAIDDRIRVSAPVNMISHTMQGGCLCENGSLLRIGTNNMEIGALMAPRPLLMISATGDWTKDTPTVEYPALRHIYGLYGAADRLAQHQVTSPHNYNRESREHVYAWMQRWLQGLDVGDTVPERPFTVEKVDDMLALAPGSRPRGELGPSQLLESLITTAKASLNALQPHDRAGWQSWREAVTLAYQACLGVAAPLIADTIAEAGAVVTIPHGTKRSLLLGRRGVGDRVQGHLYEPSTRPGGAVLVVADTAAPGLKSLVAGLMQKHQVVLVLQPFPRKPGDATYPDADFFVTYNLPPAADQGQDVLTALSWLHARDASWRPAVLGLGPAALSVLAGQGLDPRVGRVAIDCGGMDLQADETYRQSLFLPSIRRLGGLDTVVALAAPRPAWLFDAIGTLPVAAAAYQITKPPGHLRFDGRAASESDLVQWLAS